MSIPDPKDDPDVGEYFHRLPEAEYLPTWYAQRAGGAVGTEEQSAAVKAAVHAETPSVTYMDSLGRTFLTVAHNKLERSGAPLTGDPPTEAFYSTRVVYDIEGNQREVIDALDHIVMRYDYDMLGSVIHSESMDAGERWMLNDVAGKPLYGWDSRDHRLHTVYDVLRRPTEVYLQEGGGPELLVGKTVYGESRLEEAAASNLRGKVYRVFDGAGVVTTDAYDFKGNSLRSSRQLAVDYKNTLNWSVTVALKEESFTTSTTFDALNRPVTLTTPDNSTIRPTYNEANLLERVDANLRGETRDDELVWTPFVTNIDYNAKGQRERIDYDNGVATTYDYDRLTFRLLRLQTLKGPGPLQDLSYTYDPAGNITHIRDEAQQTLYFRNTRVEPSNDYTYNAIYELIEATGREHLGQIDGRRNPPTVPDAFNQFHTGLDHPGDSNAMGLYQESYVYDAVGNIRTMQHRGTDPMHPGWTRAYTYAEPSLLDTSETSNRLTRTMVGNTPETYGYKDAQGNDVNGCMSSINAMQLVWDFEDQLQRVALGGGGTAYYVYDAAGQRVRKVWEKAPGLTEERIYLGGFEVYRKRNGNGSVTLERETLHLMDGQQRIALVETRTQGDDGSAAQLIRYQLGNHLGSASLELNEAGDIISYEEYYPYGSTSYQAVDASIKAEAKRYRYTGMERDEETGLNYHGARYYAPWLGRWTGADPAGLVDGSNRYSYVRRNPVRFWDKIGSYARYGPYEEVTVYANPASPLEAAAAFGEGFIHGAFWGFVATFGLVGLNAAVAGLVGVSAAAAAPFVLGAAAIVGVGLLLLNAGSIVRGLGRLVSGKGTKEDWRGVGNAVGGAAGGALAGPAAPAATQAAGFIGSLGRAAIQGSTRAGVGELAVAGAGSAAGDASAIAGQSIPKGATLMGRRGRGPGAPVAGAAEGSTAGAAEGSTAGAAEGSTAGAAPWSGSSAGGDTGPIVRIRHYTNAKGLKGIKKDGVILTQDQGRVFADRASARVLAPIDAEAKFRLKKGRGRNYVETEVPANIVEEVYNPATKTTELQIKGNVTLQNPKFVRRN